MTTATAINDDGSGSGNANATAENAGTAAHRQSNEDVEARLAGVEALLDQSARMIKTLHGASFLFFFNSIKRRDPYLLADSLRRLALFADPRPPTKKPNPTTTTNSCRRALRGQAAGAGRARPRR